MNTSKVLDELVTLENHVTALTDNMRDYEICWMMLTSEADLFMGAGPMYGDEQVVAEWEKVLRDIGLLETSILIHAKEVKKDFSVINTLI